jgi:Baseplate J-like protein
MPLPIPTLDDLTWAELVEDARDHIPSVAPRWTDHNIHDPGITLLELLSAVTEQISFRIDQVPPSHRTAFLALLGVRPAAAEAATAVLEAASPTPRDISFGRPVVAEAGGASSSFVVSRRARVNTAQVAELQILEASGQETRLTPRSSRPFEPLGSDAESSLVIVLSPSAARGPLAIWFAGAYDDERNPGPSPCPDDTNRHPVELGWAYADATGWRTLPAEAIDDDTLGLQRSGTVTISLPDDGVTMIRCRPLRGRYDRAPALLAVWCNPILVHAELAGALGGPPAAADWRLSGPPLGAPVTLSAPLGARPGRDAESVDDAMGRAAITLSVHERLVDLAAAHSSSTLDGIPRSKIIGSPTPPRAVTLLDLERIAFATPGASLARAHALGGVDVDVPCAEAPGTVSVVVVPFLPRQRPQPTADLIARVSRQLARHRTVGTRIRVAGPTYTAVDVVASVVGAEGADPVKTRTGIERAIRTFLDPLVGGPDGQGWPFGRDVYRTELMTVVGAVPGVELVTDVRVTADPCDACPNACVPDGSLVSLRSLRVEVT